MKRFRSWFDDAGKVARAGLVVAVVATLITAAAFARDLFNLVIEGPEVRPSASARANSEGPLPADPSQWRGRTVRIGINGKLPGWSSYTASPHTGFDIALSNHLAATYQFEIEWRVLNQADRSLQWPCNGQAGASMPADLVISAFSITPPRLACFPMAGPYYLDVNTLWRNADKPQFASDGKEHGCAIRGTTGWEKMDEYRKNKTYFELRGDSELAACVGSFFDPSNPISLISSDWSILRAFNPDVEVKTLAGEVVHDPDQPASSADVEKYGVAVAPELRAACVPLAATIGQFLRRNWKYEANEHLESRKVQPGKNNWHQPTSTDPAYCAQPAGVVAEQASTDPSSS